MNLCLQELLICLFCQKIQECGFHFLHFLLFLYQQSNSLIPGYLLSEHSYQTK